MPERGMVERGMIEKVDEGRIMIGKGNDGRGVLVGE